MRGTMSTRPSRLLGSIALAAAGAAAFAACGGAQPQTAAPSDMMAKSFAGQNKCNPKTHDRPFIIDWDATDMSQFEAHAKDDVVFVRYEGCELKVLDACRDDAVKGQLGSYNSPEWTSGSVEALDIHDEGELVAKLPLGVATLGGRVSKGEQFHMEYYVAGTRKATRQAVYRSDLAKNPACKDATHFVYGFNLGAFALANRSDLKAEVNGSYFGFGAGGSKSSSTRADKKGGDLATCKSESAKEIEGCKVPVRLTLREVSEGANPEIAAAKAPETDASANLAGQLKADTQREKDAAQHLDTARQKLAARDGKGCMAELDQHDKLDPRPMGLSTNAKAGFPAMLRGQCLMLAGQCDAGKVAIRKQQEQAQGANGSPEQIDKMVDAMAGQYCQGASMAPRDQLIKARMDLQTGAFMAKKDVAFCKAAFDTIWKLKDTVKPRDDDDTMVKDPAMLLMSMGPACFAKAGDCDAAFSAYRTVAPAVPAYKDLAWVKDEAQLRRNFETTVRQCKK